MTNNEKDPLNRAKKVLKETLGAVPFLELVSVKAYPGGADLLVELKYKGKRSDCAVEVKSLGQPKYAREAVYQLERLTFVRPGVYGIFMAPYISEEAGAILAEKKTGYMDFSGNCRLAFDGIYIERKGAPNAFAVKRDLRKLYSPKAARVLRVLLTGAKKAWKMAELSAEAGVSLGQTANVKAALAEREWLDASAPGLRLADPAAVLAQWAREYDFRKNIVRECYSVKSPAETEAGLEELCAGKGIPFALAGFSAAARLRPAVRYQRGMAYVGEFRPELLAAAGIKEVESGGNMLLLLPYDAGVFYGSVKTPGGTVTGAVQTYLDLAGHKGRGEEAAAEILEHVIKPSW
ncbi:MAG TPA: type IV toxin-antitoxin system AbiEi family antitoxin [Elusimicrobiales bacterium]|nr:type IV toxin-antitoxin system AbiEi family antitoxin [Elusimicrobiales bacterium]